ncbi:signal transduction histidine kinase [Comamonas odontotermitis]|uniref:Signal transduction histidine kinase n=1 Tax=Comamonas odontotermitis TaxID=379895 RepID=A0ABR6RE76_9BURK|nr:hypothetical protein [Comamonas odontotermitis]MBB6577455.1 signal transduction histidine kinase [Comamonas odontotermitis]
MHARPSDRMNQRWPWLVIAVLVLIGLVRFFTFSTHTPLLGYPNNFDFLRTSSCVGIWNFDERSEFFHSPAPDRVVATLVYNSERLWQFCNPSTEALYLSSLKLWHKLGDHFPLQQLGYAKLAVVLAAFSWLLFAISSMRLRLFLTICFVLLLGDLSVLMYFHSLYPVFTCLFFSLFLAVALLACRFNAFTHHRSGWLLMAGLTFLLGFSNQQYLFLGVVMAALFVLMNGRRYPAHAVTVLCSIALAGLCQLYLRPVESKDLYASIDRVNRTDTIFYGVLMNSSNPQEAAAALGLRPECAQFAGVSAHMFSEQRINTCPEVSQVSRFKLLNLAFRQPVTIAKTLLNGVNEYQFVYGFIKHYFPRHASELAPALFASSPSSLIVASPRPLYYAGLTMMTLIAAAAFVFSLISRGKDTLWACAIWIGGLVCFYTLFSAVFGDGMVEVERHMAVFLAGFIMLWMGVFFQLSQSWLRHVH